MGEFLLYLLIGLVVGILSGMLGIGGGVLIVPILVFFCHYGQRQAQGTSLGMLLPPIGLLAVYTYHKAGYVDLRISMYMALGFLIGGLFGANLATLMDASNLRRLFGLFMLFVSLKMLLAAPNPKNLAASPIGPPEASSLKSSSEVLQKQGGEKSKGGAEG